MLQVVVNYYIINNCCHRSGIWREYYITWHHHLERTNKIDYKISMTQKRAGRHAYCKIIYASLVSWRTVALQTKVQHAEFVRYSLPSERRLRLQDPVNGSDLWVSSRLYIWIKCMFWPLWAGQPHGKAMCGVRVNAPIPCTDSKQNYVFPMVYM